MERVRLLGFGSAERDVSVLRWRMLALALVLGVALIAALHFTCLRFYPKPELDRFNLSDFYPFSVFRLRLPKPYQLGIGLVYLLSFGWAWSRLSHARPKLWLVLGAGLGLAVLSNLLHGLRFGLDFPTATDGAGGIEYFHDAVEIPGPIWLLRHFNAVQFELLEHSRTHPPGPVMLYWLLYQVLRAPALISIAISALTLGLSLPPLRRLLALSFGEEPPGALLLFAILPGILIYGLAVIDGPIAGMFLACLTSFVDERRRSSWLWSALWLFCSLFFTFSALFLLPVLVGFECLRRRRVTRSLSVIAVAVALLGLLRLTFGFDWLGAFLKATAMENAPGFLLFAEPRRYVWYRLGAVAEILAFFTPFLGLLLIRGWGALKRCSEDAWALAGLGPLSLLCLLLTGSYKIGEAARICLFILPCLLLPVLAAFRALDAASRARVAYAVAGYGLVMQLFGFYQW
jgi:hypothetical protein